MVQAKPYLNYLSIRQDGKGVPYGGMSEPREDGTQNFGFKNIKGAPQDVALIPELRDDAPMRDLMAALAHPDVGVFTIGCESGPVEGDGQLRLTGYVEFSLNSRSAIGDAAVYFPLFFHFDRFLHETAFAASVMFTWELMAASFVEKHVDGFTCTVFVNTSYSEKREQAEAWWAESMACLREGLCSIPVYADPLY